MADVRSTLDPQYGDPVNPEQARQHRRDHEILHAFLAGQQAAAGIGVYKATDTPLANVAVFADDPHLVLTLPSAGTYRVQGALFADGGTVGDLKLNLAGSGGASGFWNATVLGATATSPGSAATSQAYRIGAGTFGGGMVGLGTFVVIQISGSVTVTGPGTVKVQWAQLVADATPTTLYAGSWLVAAKF